MISVKSLWCLYSCWFVSYLLISGTAAVSRWGITRREYLCLQSYIQSNRQCKCSQSDSTAEEAEAPDNWLTNPSLRRGEFQTVECVEECWFLQSSFIFTNQPQALVHLLSLLLRWHKTRCTSVVNVLTNCVASQNSFNCPAFLLMVFEWSRKLWVYELGLMYYIKLSTMHL